MVPLLFLGGCSKSDPPAPPVPILSQQQADEIAQQVSVTAAYKMGGWLYEVEATVLAVPGNGAQPARRGPSGVERDTMISTAQMAYDINYQYRLGGGGLSAVWDTAAVEIEATSSGVGRILYALGDRHDGEYRHHGTFEADGIHAGFDTLSFSGLLQDSSLATIRNFVTHEVRYYFMDVFIDYDFEILKDQTLHPNPLNGGATLTIDADQLDSLDRNDVIDNLLVECRIAFDGTGNPLMTVIGDPGDPRTIFRYRVNLADGTLVRAP